MHSTLRRGAPFLAASLLATSALAAPSESFERLLELTGTPAEKLEAMLLNHKTDRPTRRAIPYVLAFQGAFDRVPAISRASRKDPDPLVRESAVSGLGYLGVLLRSLDGMAPGLASIELGDISDALAATLSDRDARVRGQAAAALASMGVAVKGTFDPLVDLLTNTEEPVVQHAALALGHFHFRLDEAVAKLQPLLKDRREATRVAAAAALVRLGKDDEATRSVIEKGLTSNHPRAREAAISALGLFQGPNVIPRLWKALQDPAPQVREAAAHGLAGAGDAARITRARLERLLAHDRSPAVRAAAALALPSVAGDLAIPALAKALANEDPEVGTWAAMALLTLGDGGRAELERVASEGSGRGRRRAQRALAMGAA